LTRSKLPAVVLPLVFIAVVAIVLNPRGKAPSTGVESAPLPHHPAPDIALPLLTGATFHLDHERGRIVLLNFWASWCVPCRHEMPELAGWYRRFHRRGLDIVGIDQQEPASDVRSFTSPLHIPYPLALDSSGAVSATYHASALPQTFAVDRHGIIRAVKYGAVDPSFLKSAIGPLFRSRN
jgi:peroxiredoxin